PLPVPERGFPVLLSEDPAPHLVALDALEQRLEVALAEAFVALALDDLEEDRADRVLGEDLQQLALLGLGIRVDQDPVAAQALHVLAVLDRKSTRLNSSHVKISYAVFCLKKKKNIMMKPQDRHPIFETRPQISATQI